MKHAAASAAAFSFVLATGISIASVASAYAQAPVTERSTTPPATAPSAPSAVNAPTEVPTKLAPPLATPLATNPTKSFVAVGDKPTVLFDAPSARANKTFILLRGTPLEVLVKLDKWTKVRDAENAIGWVENTGLGDKRHVQVSAATADVRNAPSAAAQLVFDAQKGVLLEVTGAASPDGWMPVRHRDGQTGFVRVSQIWGE
jgi:SH3-like domain-containing protein